MLNIGYIGRLPTYHVTVDGDINIEVTSPNQIQPKDGAHAIDWDDEVF